MKAILERVANGKEAVELVKELLYSEYKLKPDFLAEGSLLEVQKTLKMISLSHPQKDQVVCNAKLILEVSLTL